MEGVDDDVAIAKDDWFMHGRKSMEGIQQKPDSGEFPFLWSIGGDNSGKRAKRYVKNM